MNKKAFRLIAIFLAICVLHTFVSCGGKKTENDTLPKVESQDSKLLPRSVQLSVFSSMPVEGDNADFFRISGPNGSDTITLTGKPDDTSSMGRGSIKANIDLSILKSLNDEVYQWGNYSGLKLTLLDEDHEEITSLSLSDTDKKLVETELAKSKTGTVNVIFKTNAFSREYNKVFDMAKYVRLEGATFTGKKAHDKEVAAEEAKALKEAKASESKSSSSSSSSYDSDYDDGDSGEKSRWQKIKDKTKEKTKALKEKATEKLDDWLDR